MAEAQIDLLVKARETIAMLVPLGEDTGTVEQNIADYVAKLLRWSDTARREVEEGRGALADLAAELRTRRDHFRNVAVFHRATRRYQATIYSARADGIEDVFKRHVNGPSGLGLTTLLDEARREGMERAAVIAESAPSGHGFQSGAMWAAKAIRTAAKTPTSTESR